MLRSPAPSAATCCISTSIQKPLPSRPRSASVPSTLELPAELPGSLLLENQGFPSCEIPVPAWPSTQTFRRESHPPDKHFDDERDSLDLLNLVPAPLTHASSVPDLSVRHNTMRSVRSGNAFNSSTAAKPSPLKVQHKKSLSETGSRRRSNPNLVTSALSTNSKFTICSPSISTIRDSSNDPTRARVDARPLITEEEDRKHDLGRYSSYRNEVSALVSLLMCVYWTNIITA
jgi:hypothetical protein